MKQLQVVPPQSVYQLWETIRPYFEASVDASSGDCTAEQLKTILANGQQTLFVVVEDELIIGSFSISINNHPNNRVALITAFGGNGITNIEVFEQVVTWAKAQGATKIKAIAKEAQARLYRQKVGLNTTMYVVETLI